MMLEEARRSHPAAIVAMAAMVFAVAVFAGLVSAGSAFADHGWGPGGHGWDEAEAPPTLNESWAPVNRCPVDDPMMLAVTGVEAHALCAAESSPSGSFTTGNLTVAFKATNHQFGLILNN